MALTDRAIITLDDAKTYLKLSLTDTTKDDVVSEFIESASNWIEKFIQNPVNPQKYTEQYNGDGAMVIYPNHYPILPEADEDEDEKDEESEDDDIDAPLIELRSNDGLGTWSDLLTSEIAAISQFIGEYPEEANRIILLDGYSFPQGIKNIRITYWAGWTDVPYEILQVCKEQVLIMWNESKYGDSLLGRKSKGVSGQGTNWTDSYQDMIPRWKEQLRKYKRLV